MKQKILIGFIIVGLSSFVLTSCTNSDKNKTSEKELELQKKELDLKQKELELKEKELAFNSATNANHQNTTELNQKQVKEKNKYSEELKNNLPLKSIAVPISLEKLISKLGKSQNNIEEWPSGSFYIWTFRNGLYIDASFSGSEEEEKKIFDKITLSIKSKKIIPNCPFDFILNETTYDEVNSKFNYKLRKLDYVSDEFKVYSNRMWNYFKFKNKILIEITIATWEQDMTN